LYSSQGEEASLAAAVVAWGGGGVLQALANTFAVDKKKKGTLQQSADISAPERICAHQNQNQNQIYSQNTSGFI
jgi:hypothetical protein